MTGRGRRSRPRWPLLRLLLLVLLLAGCGLRAPSGVQVPGPVRAEDPQRPGDVIVLPPGPRPGAGPVDVVEGFLGAQSAPEGRHAIARQFLAAGTRWDDEAGLEIYDPETLSVTSAPEDPLTVVVSARVTGSVGSDGAYDDTGHALRETYRLAVQGRSTVLTGVPQGLRLTPADRDRAVRPTEVYYVARPEGQSSGTSPHLVADRVFLPATAPLAQELVVRLLRGPSGALAGLVQTAVPTGTGLRGPVTLRGGTATVDLTDGAQRLDDLGRARLSAQLVWTLRAAGPEFQRLDLRAGGRPLAVPGRAQLQQRSDWGEFDPDGLAPQVPAYYVSERSLRSLDTPPRANALDASVPVDAAAVSTSGGQVALLTDTAAGVEVRTGPSGGPYPVRARAPRLSSPTWGNAEDGLWLLRAGLPVLVRGDASRRLTVVPLEGPDVPAVATALRVSRDGVRAALVGGQRLYVGLVERGPTGVRLVQLHRIAGSLSGVRDVAWESGTQLVVLARAGRQSPLPVRVAVDGSVVAPVARAGLVGVPTALAAAPERPLTIATEERGVQRIFRDDGSFFQPRGQGSAPSYPG